LKLKILKPVTIENQPYEVDAILEVEDQSVCDALIADQSAEMYTADLEAQDQAEAETELVKAEADKIKVEQKSFKAVTKTAGEKNMDIISKAISNLETKAITGAATLSPVESGTIVTAIIDSPIINQAKQAQTEALTYNVLYDGACGDGDVAITGYTAEATESELDAPLKVTKVNLGKIFGTVLVSNDILRMQNGADQSVTNQIHNKAVRAIENGMFAGAFASNSGFEGICTSAKSTAVTVTAIGTVEEDKIDIVMGKVFDSDKNAFYCNSAYWRLLVTALADETNLNGQKITDGAVKTLKGYKVFTSVNVPAAKPLVFGSLPENYEFVSTGVEVEPNTNAGFLKDCKAYAVRVFVGGAIAGVKKTIDGVEYAPFAYLKQA